MKNTDSNNEANSPLASNVVETETHSTLSAEGEIGGCGYQGYEFGAGSYPDSVCMEGRLWDADDCDDDHRLYEPAEDIPCPVCRPADAIDYWARQNRLRGATQTAARNAAKSLVTDILSKRGLLADGQVTSEQKG